MLVIVAWVSKPTVTGWWWVRINDGNAALVYIDTDKNTLTICDPTVGKCAQGSLDDIKPGITFQGPVVPVGAGTLL
jgi:hypothetical protein